MAADSSEDALAHIPQSSSLSSRRTAQP